jgi:hypothetical protein
MATVLSSPTIGGGAGVGVVESIAFFLWVDGLGLPRTTKRCYAEPVRRQAEIFINRFDCCVGIIDKRLSKKLPEDGEFIWPAACILEIHRWHQICGHFGVGRTAEIKISAWAKAEQRKKAREQNRGRVRNIFGFLFCAAVVVFIFSDHSDLQKFIQSKIYPAISHALARNGNCSNLKQGALKHESEVDEIIK